MDALKTIPYLVSIKEPWIHQRKTSEIYGKTQSKAKGHLVPLFSQIATGH
jgi:hypothetical protein